MRPGKKALNPQRDSISKSKKSPLHLVSVAHEKTLPVLEAGQGAILSLVPATTYTVIVPDKQVEQFRNALNPEFAIHPEGAYIDDLRPRLASRFTGSPEGLGWYLQQFIKMAAIHQFAPLGNVLIWDADTIPLRKLGFFSRSGRPSYFISSENHAEYFASISRALGLEKKDNFSFIAQCFPITSAHAYAFFTELSQSSASNWWAPLIDSIDFTRPNAFSEYETLGTFISHRFPRDLRLQRGIWVRNGWALFSGPKESTNRIFRVLAAPGISYCSFEQHQVPRVPLTLRRRLHNYFQFALRALLFRFRRAFASR